MKTCIAFLRGINVGGKNPLPMKTFAGILKEMGAQNVRTYIQSGNAVFETPKAMPEKLSEILCQEIDRRLGFKPNAFVMTFEELARAASENPFPEAEESPASLHLSFLASQPEKPNIEKLAQLRKESERFHLGDGVFYLHAPEGIGRSKLAASVEKLLGVAMTDRNWRTVRQVLKMAATAG